MGKAGAGLARAERAMLAALTPQQVAEIRQLLATVLIHWNDQPGSAMPLFREVVQSSQWPIETGEMDVAALVEAPQTRNEQDEDPVVLPNILERLSTLQLFVTAGLRYTRVLEQILEPVGLDAAQAITMLMLEQQNDLHDEELAQVLAFPTSKIPPLLAPLERRYLICNSKMGKRHLTPGGRQMLRKIRPALKKLDIKLLSALPGKQSEALRSIMLSLSPARPA
jgi:DNA-binding MarR family transcriptional regulator